MGDVNLTYGELLEKTERAELFARTNVKNPEAREYLRKFGQVEQAISKLEIKLRKKIPLRMPLPEEVRLIYEKFREYHNQTRGDQLGII